MKKTYGNHKIAAKSGMNLDELSKFFATAVGSGGGRPEKPYSQVVCVYACIKARGDALCLPQLTICDDAGNVIESGPLVDLVYQPNPKTTGRAFWRATSAYLDLFGVVFWRKVMIGTRVVEVYAHGKHEMERLVDGGGNVTGYRYSPLGSGTQRTLLPEDVHEVVDPDYEAAEKDKPLSPRQAVSMAISQYYKSDLANESSLDNDSTPGGILNYKDGVTPEQKNEVIRAVAEKHAGAGNRKKVMVLSGNVEWQTVASAFAEMEFTELKKMSRTDICVGYSTPPAVIGYYEDSNYSHTDAAQGIFWENTNIPRGVWLAEEWDRCITTGYEGDQSMRAAQAFKRAMTLQERNTPSRRKAYARARAQGRRIYAYFDVSMVSAVQRGRLSLSAQAKTWWDMGIPLNDLIQAFDLPFTPQPYGDVGKQPIGLQDANADAGTAFGSDDPTAPPESPELEDPAPAPPAGDGVKGLGWSDGDEGIKAADLDAVWRAHRASWKPLEKAVEAKVSRHFMDLRTQTLNRLKAELEGKSFEPDQVKGILGRVLFSLVEANKQLIGFVGKLLREAHRLGGEQSMQEAADAQGKSDKPDPYNIKDPLSVSLMRQREIRITETNRTLRTSLAESLAQGLEAKETSTELAERVRTGFNASAGRARTIAFTEVSGAVEEARQVGRTQAGIPKKSWLSSRKQEARGWHMDIEVRTMKAPIANDEEFVSGKTGATALQPKGFGVPQEDINCGCSTIGRFDGDQLKAVVARYLSKGVLSYDQLMRRDWSTTQAGKK